MLTNILIVVGILIAAVLVVAAFRPSEFTIVRRATLPASASALFAKVNQMNLWPAWSPWEKLDPAMKRTFEGPASGVGSIYGWEGNKNAGSGRMVVTESRPNELIRIKLEFYSPMPGICSVEFAFKPQGSQTEVSWIMSGTHTYLARIFTLFMSMERMIGDKHAQGLQDLGRVAAEAAAQSR